MIDKVKKLKDKGGIKWLFTNTIPFYLYKYLDPIVSFFVKSIYIRKPLEDVIIIESHNDFDSNGGAFYEYLINNGLNKRYKIVWFLRNKCPGILPQNVVGVRYNRISIRRWYYLCIAKYIIWGHQVIEPIRNGQISVYTSHGPGGFKNTRGIERMPESITYVMTLSKEYSKIQFPTIYGSKRLVSLGYPEHDILYTKENNEINKITDKSYNKTILWMPTFRNNTAGDRKDSTKDQPIGIPLFSSLDEYRKFNTFLQEKNTLLILKMHPMADLRNVKVMSTNNILIVTGEDVKKKNVNVNKLMLCSDALISDYSSVAYTYLHLDRPIAYVFDDMDDYKLGFVVDDIHKLTAGHEIYSIEDLMKFVDDVVNDDDPYRERRKQMSNYIFDYHDGNSSKRLSDYLGLLQ